MHGALAFLAFAASTAAVAMPQGVTQAIPPKAPIPAGCSKDYTGSFQVTTVNVTSSKKRDLSSIEKRQSGILTLTLKDSILKDAFDRTGYIASNFQFQFDAPPQAGSIYTAGFSVCQNGSLALGGSAIFYQCYSGGFYNLYDRWWAEQCSPIYIEVMGGSPSAAKQIPDGQPQANPVNQIGDGQVQGPTGKPVGQIPDGQVQGPTGKPVGQIPDGQVQGPTGKPVGQIPDGQVQAPTGKPVSQIPDGQVQAPTGKPVSQIPDGQVQAPKPTGKPVSQIGDGQVQAPGPSPVTENKNGVPQATAPAGSRVSQIPDGQVQAPAGGSPKPSVAQFTGAANVVSGSFVAVAAGFLGVVAML